MECAMRSIGAASESRRLSSGHGLSSVSIEPLVMDCWKRKKKQSGMTCPLRVVVRRAVCSRAAACHPARRANAFSFEIADETPRHNPLRVKSKKRVDRPLLSLLGQHIKARELFSFFMLHLSMFRVWSLAHPCHAHLFQSLLHPFLFL